LFLSTESFAAATHLSVLIFTRAFEIDTPPYGEIAEGD